MCGTAALQKKQLSWNSGHSYFVHGWTDQTDHETAGQSNLSQETGSTHRPFDDNEHLSHCKQHSSFLNYDNCSQRALLSEYIDPISVGIQLIMLFLTQDALVLWVLSMPLTDFRACQNHPNAELVYFTKEPSQSRVSFANGQQSSVREKLVVHFRNDHSR